MGQAPARWVSASAGPLQHSVPGPPRSAVFPDLSPVTLLPTLHPPAPRPQTGRFDFSEWVRAYGLYLEEQLEVFAALGWRVEQEQAGTESRMRSLT